MFQGNFFTYEDVKTCLRGNYNFICFEEKEMPPRIQLLDRATDRFVEQKLDIDYHNYDFFWMSA